MKNKALFLDRDGIINVDHGYVYKKEDFHFTDGIFDVCRHAISLGFDIYIITNQAGIGRGYYSVNDFLVLTKWMKETFNNEGVKISDVFYCPHHPTEGVGIYKESCQCRKPAPGMLIEAKDKYNINLSKSFFIGDKISDMEAAQAAGITNRILINSKYLNSNESINAIRIANIRESIPFIT
jgi:D-glycero-D-manno-heptose 1,7-bisphosphate phosphatase